MKIVVYWIAMILATPKVESMECYVCITKTLKEGQEPPPAQLPPPAPPPPPKPPICQSFSLQEVGVITGNEIVYRFRNGIKLTGDVMAELIYLHGIEVRKDTVWRVEGQFGNPPEDHSSERTFPLDDLTLTQKADGWDLCSPRKPPPKDVEPPPVPVVSDEEHVPSCENFETNKEKLEAECISDSFACFTLDGEVVETSPDAEDASDIEPIKTIYKVQQKGCFLSSNFPLVKFKSGSKCFDDEGRKICVCDQDFYCNFANKKTVSAILLLLITLYWTCI